MAPPMPPTPIIEFHKTVASQKGVPLKASDVKG